MVTAHSLDHVSTTIVGGLKEGDTTARRVKVAVKLRGLQGRCRRQLDENVDIGHRGSVGAHANVVHGRCTD